MDLEERVKRIEELLSVQNQMLITNARLIKELSWANVFHDATRGCPWLPSEGLPCWPGRGAAGYQYMYIMFRLLNELQPRSILEIGMGQSTRLIGQYIKTRGNNPGYRHYCVDHDAEWATICKGLWPIDERRSEIIILPLSTMAFTDEGGNRKDTIIYDGFFDHFSGMQFDVISIDGPFGFNDPIYSRIDTLEIIPQCLNEDFCIIVDDYNRSGEQKTVEAIKAKLSANNIEFDEAIYRGEKDVCVLTSKSWSFLCTL